MVSVGDYCRIWHSVEVSQILTVSSDVHRVIYLYNLRSDVEAVNIYAVH